MRALPAQAPRGWTARPQLGWAGRKERATRRLAGRRAVGRGRALRGGPEPAPPPPPRPPPALRLPQLNRRAARLLLLPPRGVAAMFNRAVSRLSRKRPPSGKGLHGWGTGVPPGAAMSRSSRRCRSRASFPPARARHLLPAPSSVFAVPAAAGAQSRERCAGEEVCLKRGTAALFFLVKIGEKNEIQNTPKL